MRVGIGVLRIVVGVLFMGHGLQKLAGWFGGGGLRGTGQFFEGLGLRPGRAQAAAAGVAETAGGALVAAGLFTPVGASLITGTMAVAVNKVHASSGLWATEGGYEYNLVLVTAVFAITAAGPGEWSLDERLGTTRSGTGVALCALGAGLAGAGAAVALGGRMGTDEEGAPAEG